MNPDILKRCKLGERSAQRVVYERYSPLMLGLCMRYFSDRSQAEGVMVEGMFKVLTRIDQFSGSGSFEGWVRRTMVNECLMVLRKEVRFIEDLSEREIALPDATGTDDTLHEHEILTLIQSLPAGYRTVFNLYVIEGYKHREIAELLEISINTSKSQLLLARKRLEEMIRERETYLNL